MHVFWKILLERPILPHLDFTPQQILDIGSGSGIYCIELASILPESQVHGIDISPIQPLLVPENCTFYQADVMEGLWFRDETFDFIHSRDIHSAILGGKWAEYLREIYRLLKPGGWVQLVELDPWPGCDDGTLKMDSAWIAYLQIMKKAFTRIGLRYLDWVRIYISMLRRQDSWILRWSVKRSLLEDGQRVRQFGYQCLLWR